MMELSASLKRPGTELALRFVPIPSLDLRLVRKVSIASYRVYLMHVIHVTYATARKRP
jgi:hypothetical protein